MPHKNDDKSFKRKKKNDDKNIIVNGKSQEIINQLILRRRIELSKEMASFLQEREENSFSKLNVIITSTKKEKHTRKKQKTKI